MTLVAINFQSDRFIGMSDSRISGAHRITDRFTKLRELRYKFTSGGVSEPFLETHSGSLGFGYSGSTLFAMAFFSTSENILCSLHQHRRIQNPPRYFLIRDALRKVADSMLSDIIGMEQIFESIVFGFCPMDGTPFFLKIGFEFTERNLQIKNEIFSATKQPIVTIGSGSEFFNYLWNSRRKGDVFEAIFDKSVNMSPDVGTGGQVQILELDRNHIVRRGVRQSSNEEGGRFDFWGIDRKEFGNVGGYTLGRGYRFGLDGPNLLAHLHARKHGLDPFSRKLPDGVTNARTFGEALLACAKNNKKLHLEGNYCIEPPILLDEEYYFIKLCRNCFLSSPLLHDPNKGSYKNPCTHTGTIEVPCIHCGRPIKMGSSEFISKRFPFHE